MAIAQFTQFKVVDAIERKINSAVKDLAKLDSPSKTILGTDIKDQKTIQLAVEPTSPATSSSLQPHFGAPTQTLTVKLNRSPFGPNGAVTRPLVEYVQSWYPVSRATPEFQKQMEDEFERFNSLAFKDASVARGANYVFGWVVEEQEHEEVKGEKAKCWFMVRGWDSMELFEEFMQSEEAKEHLPILFQWPAPYKMWHVERKALVGVEEDA